MIIDWLVSEFKNDEGPDLSKDAMALQRLKDAAEKAKIELSSSNSTEINLPYITSVDGTPKHLVKTLTRAKFEQLSHDIIQRAVAPCKQALKDAKLEPSDIDEVILVGGSTRIPALQELAKDIFGKEPSKAVNPDEAVSLGASIQGAILNRESGVGDIVLLDVCPLNMGINTENGIMATLIEANTTIPCKKTQTFTNAADNQTAITVEVLQGNRPMAKDNKRIGIFNLEGLVPAPRGTMKIDVTFDIDANGILNVSAKDQATDKEQKIRIEASSSLSKEEIEKMKAEAEANAEADKKEKEKAEIINKGDSLRFTQQKLLEEQKDNLNEDEKSKIEGFIKDLDEAVKEKDTEKITALETQINALWQEISQRIYNSKASESSADRTQGNASEGQGNTQDAEFEEVK